MLPLPSSLWRLQVSWVLLLAWRMLPLGHDRVWAASSIQSASLRWEGVTAELTMSTEAEYHNHVMGVNNDGTFWFFRMYFIGDSARGSGGGLAHVQGRGRPRANSAFEAVQLWLWLWLWL